MTGAGPGFIVKHMVTEDKLPRWLSYCRSAVCRHDYTRVIQGRMQLRIMTFEKHNFVISSFLSLFTVLFEICVCFIKCVFYYVHVLCSITEYGNYIMYIHQIMVDNR